METSEQPIFPGFEGALQSCRPGFPASRPPLPGSAEAQAMTVGSGRQLSMLLNQSDPLGLFSKILLGSSLWTSSEEFCYVWQILDTRFACSAFQLMALEPSTGGNGSSSYATDLWRTPIAWEGGYILETNKAHEKQRGAHSLTTQAMQPRLQPKLWRTPDGQRAQRHGSGDPNLALAAKLWPTPRANENDQGPENRRKVADSGLAWAGQGRGMTLSTAANLWRTPNATDSKGKSGPNCIAFKEGRTNRLADQFPQGSLNPRFVEQLMGFPIDHTALKPSATPSAPSKLTRSSRRLRKQKKNCWKAA